MYFGNKGTKPPTNKLSNKQTPQQTNKQANKQKHAPTTKFQQHVISYSSQKNNSVYHIKGDYTPNGRSPRKD